MRRIPGTDLDVFPLCLGGNVFGWTADERESVDVLDRYIEVGGNFIDTADMYAGGESEAIIGRWMLARANRDWLVIATKVGMAPGFSGLGAATIRAAVEESLKRLQVEHIDLYYAHRDDETVEQAEYVGAFDDLVKAGKIREAGASNFTLDRLQSALKVAKDAGQTGFTVAQDKLNLVDRDLEATLPALETAGIVELPYSALASGFLTGKYREGVDVESARAGGASKHLDNPKNVELLGTLDGIAADRGVSVTAIALAWLRQQTAVDAPIASARTVDQLQHLVESFNLVLSADELARLG